MAALTDRGPGSARSIETWDLVHGLREWRLWAFLGLQDIRQRYRRSLLGPFWLTLGLGATVIGIGLLYSQILKSPANQYVPFIAISLLVWNMLSACVNESTTMLTGAQGVITSIQVPYTSFALRLIMRNLIVAAHSLIVVVIAFVWYRFPVSPTIIAAIPGLILFCLNMYWITLGLGLLCARYRDVAQMVIYTLGLVFFLTPVIWLPGTIRAGNPFILYNPLAQLLNLIRDPVYSHTIPFYSFFYCFWMMIIGGAITVAYFYKVRRRVAYWV